MNTKRKEPSQYSRENVSIANRSLIPNDELFGQRTHFVALDKHEATSKILVKLILLSYLPILMLLAFSRA
jgi:hypothetical protein